MKSFTKYTAFIISLLLGSAIQLKSQDCVQCSRCVTSGTNASAIGSNNTASGNNSLAGGYYSQSTGSNSLAFGYKSKAAQSTTVALGNTAVASGTGSIAIGTYVKANAQNSFVLGAGTTTSYPLTNNTPYSIAFGVNSNKPTMLITKSLNNNYTGKVAIGNVTPTAKLHIKSDSNEDAGVFIEPANKNSYSAYINLFDTDHGISVDQTAAMTFIAGSGPMNFQGSQFCYGEEKAAKTRLYTKDKTVLYYNAKRDNNIEVRDGEGPSYAIDFNNTELRFRAATYQSPRNTEITNWKNALSISSNGKIGINTINNTSDYALAVDGGIVSTKVYIKEVNLWPDYVFAEDYQLMSLEELEHYLNDHRHLPGMPSQEEVLGNGYDVNDMQRKLLEKIEEMTRYIILLKEEINGLKDKETNKSDTIVFTYDANGNRVTRSIMFKRIDSPDKSPVASQPLHYDLLPNPTYGQFSLFLHELNSEKKLHAVLLTMNGVAIDERDINGNQTTFDLSAHPPGIYLLEVEGPDGHQSWKVIKQ